MQLDSGFRSTLALAFTHANTATKKAYLKDWAIFTAASGIASLPVSPETIARFIGGQRSLGLVEIETRYSSNGDKDSNLYILLEVDPVKALDLALAPKSIL